MDLPPKRRRRFGDLPLEILLTLLSAFLYALAFPSFLNDNGFPFLATFALIPMLYAVDRTRWGYAPLLGFLFGFSYLAIFNYWLSTFHPMAIFIAPILKGFELMLYFPLMKAAENLPKKGRALLQSCSYIAYIYVGQLGFLGYPYGNLSSAFATWLPLIQISSVFGSWAISLLMFIPQSYAADFLARRHTYGISLSSHLEETEGGIYVYLALFISTLVFGFHTISYWQMQKPNKVIKIATVQHNSDTWKGGYDQYLKNFLTMKQLTEESLAENPDMVMWSETAFVPSVAWHTAHPTDPKTSKLVQDFINFGKSLPCPLVTGNPEGVIKDPTMGTWDKNGNWNRIDYNSVILFADGKIYDTYRKQHLVPFTEYFPYQKQMPRFYQWLKNHDFHWWLPGKKSKIFSYDGLDFSTSICFEDIFGSISAKFVRQGSDLLLNLSNDSWSNAVSAEMQHMRLGTFRAIENRRAVVRSTNSGITCMITPWGQVIDPIKPFTCNYHVYEVPIYSQKSFGLTTYSKHDDWFARIIFIITCISLVFQFTKAASATYKKKQHAKTITSQESGKDMESLS
ncbi:MAG: apolipoprotein N-acyltransferase [Spirochaetia bacterium]|jgi:apolipoprotein N-acyltransferase|nr:apolipoprotein N-acyltransferase [Spirochaetia bacterium]